MLVLTGFREAIMHAIPASLKRAIGVGIGLFILFIGLGAAGIVKPGPPGVPVTLGDLTAAPVAVALFGLLLTVWLTGPEVHRGAPGRHPGDDRARHRGQRRHRRAAPSRCPGRRCGRRRSWRCPTSRAWAPASISRSSSALGLITALVTIFSLMLSDFFDTMGTVIGIGGEAGWLTPDGRLPRLNRVLLVDSLGAVAGGAAGASSATTYIESAAGVAAGARTGLASVVTGACFLLALFFAPLAGVVPAQATAPALIVVGYLMSRLVREIPFGDFEEGFPALLTLTMMAFTYSITNGIGAGFVTYCFIKLVRGRGREVAPMMYGGGAGLRDLFRPAPDPAPARRPEAGRGRVGGLW